MSRFHRVLQKTRWQKFPKANIKWSWPLRRLTVRPMQCLRKYWPVILLFPRARWQSLGARQPGWRLWIFCYNQEVSKSKIFFLLSLSFIGGIFSASFYYPRIMDNFYFFITLILSLIFLVVFYGNRKVYLRTFSILFFLSGFWLTSLKLERIVNLDLASRNFSGKVLILREPAIKDRMQKIIVSNDGEERIKFLITTNSYPAYFYGDKLKVSCRLEIPENIEGFDYRMYLAKDNIFY